jgi:autotransporter-associated beta strand protein
MPNKNLINKIRISCVKPNPNSTPIRWCAALALMFLSLFTASAANLNWDANTGTTGAQDGNGNWGNDASNLRWWNGANNVTWNNANGDTAVFGVNSTTNVTVTVTNGVTAGGIIYSNAGVGVYTIANSGGAVITLSGTPTIQLSATNSGVHLISAIMSAANTVSVQSTLTNANSINFRMNATNSIGSLAVGTPGNSSYTTNGLWVDINSANSSTAINGLFANLTNVMVYSNATFRISGANVNYTLSPNPVQITISGDGSSGGNNTNNAGAWVVTGNAGGTIAANVVLAGDSTVDFNVGSATNQTFNLNGIISGTGRLMLVSGNSVTRPQTCVLTNASTYVGNTIVAGGTTLQLIGANDRLPTSTALTLGTTAFQNFIWNRFGKLTLGNSSTAVNQTLAGLTTGTTGCVVAGGNSTTPSILTVNNASDNVYAGTLGGSAAPANKLALVKGGAGNLSLQGTNLCGSYTVNNGILQIGDGATDYNFGGPITNNNAAVVFNVATALTNASAITGSGTLTKQGAGKLLLSAVSSFTGPTIISQGTLALSGSGSLASTSITNNGTFDVSGVTGTYHVTTGTTLFGAGNITGPLTVDSGATLTVGGATGIPTGTLTCNGNLTLNGKEIVRIDAGNFVSDVLSMQSGALTFAGTIEVHLVNGAVSDGQQFYIFSPGLGGATVNNAIITGDSIAPLYWDTSQLSSGILKATSTPVPPVVTLALADTNAQCSATLMAGASGAAPLVYIWTVDGATNAVGTNLTSITIATPSSPVAHSVSVVVTNAGGASATSTASVTVQDTTPPVVTLNGSNPMGVLLNSTFVEPGATATDNCSTPSLTTNNTVNTAVLGTYTNAFIATDAAGSSATNTRVVHVVNSFVWINSAGGFWQDNANWQDGVDGDIIGAANVPVDFTTLSLTGPVTVTNTNAVTIGSLWFDDQSGLGNAWMVGGSGTLTLAVSSGSPVVSNNVPTTINSQLMGSQGFIKTGTGDLTLTNVNNSYAGGTVISKGKLLVGAVNSLGSGTIILGNAGTGTNNIELSFGAVTNAPSGSSSFPDIIVTNLGTGVATISGSTNGGGNITPSAHVTMYRSTILKANYNTTMSLASYFGGQLSGPGAGVGNTTLIVDCNGGTLQYTAGQTFSNNFVGNILVTNGTWLVRNLSFNGLADSNNNLCIPDTASVTVAAGASMAFAYTTFEVIDGLNGSGTVSNQFSTSIPTLIVGGNNGSGNFSGLLANGYNGLALTKIGTGTQILGGANTYTKPTSVGGGALIINNSFASAITVSNAATLGGVGILSSNVTIQAGGLLAPGTNFVGTLTVNNSLTNVGNLFIKVDKSKPVQSNDMVTVTGVLTNTGTGIVTVTNLNPNPSFAFAAGDKFTIFNKAMANGGTMTILPATPGPNLVWTNKLAVDGSIGVLSSVALNPTNITFSVSGSTLTLSWPADHLGWHLQMQTNTLGAGLTTNGWVVVPGSDQITSTNISISKTNPTVFYRLTYP